VAALVAGFVGLGLAIVLVTPPVRWIAGPLVEPRAWWDRVRARLRPPSPPAPASHAAAAASSASRIVDPR
jgi:hypothetical protein